MATPAKLELTLKVTTLPEVTTLPLNGWKAFVLDCDGQRVTVSVRTKFWTKFETAAAALPLWTAAIVGKMGTRTPTGFELLEPSIQVFARKPKGEGTSAPPGDAAPAAT